MQASLRWALGTWAFGLASLWSGLAVGDPGDAAGWSVDTDPRKRAFLKYVPEKDGARILMFGCLRDIDSFGVYSAGVEKSNAKDAPLTIVNGGAKYAVQGEIEPDSEQKQPTFVYEADIDAAARRRIRAALMPVLTGKGPIKLTVGSTSRDVPTTGIKAPLDRFAAICFGR